MGPGFINIDQAGSRFCWVLVLWVPVPVPVIDFALDFGRESSQFLNFFGLGGSSFLLTGFLLKNVYITFIHFTTGKLLKWTSKDGIIHKETLQDLDKTRKIGKIEMEMSLAHVNVLKNLIDYQKRTKNNKFI